MSMRKENEREAKNQAGEKGGKPLQERIAKREFLGSRCGIVLHEAGVSRSNAPRQ